MCGIAGILSFGDPVIDNSSLKKMADAIAHRGPDGEDFWINENKSVGFAHRRLAIIDLSENGNQPMHYLNRYTITFNGEIYNYKELKNDLVRAGYTFNSATDTEVLLALYDQKKEKLLDDLDGMFAFALWDQSEQKLFCARDRFGEKPFYYFVSDRGFYFASEMKALFSIGITVEIDKFMVSNFLMTDLVVNPENEAQTFYQGIKKLPKASSVTVYSGGKVDIHKYYTINRNPAELSFGEATARLNNLLADSVKLRLRSDVPVASSLSGGLDSTIIESLVREELLRSRSDFGNVTLSARFDEPGYTENEYLEEAIKAGKAVNYSVYPDYRLIANELEKVFFHQEEPFWSASILNHWSVMRLATEHNIKVILEGQGADEMFAGYTWHYNTFLLELYRTSKKRYHEELKAVPGKKGIGFAGRFKVFSPGLYELLHKKLYEFRRRPLSGIFSKNEWHRLISKKYLDIHATGYYYVRPGKPDLNNLLYDDLSKYYLESLLRAGDRSSMAFSREVRLPFLDHKLVDFAFALPPDYKIKDGWQKYILRKAYEGIIPHKITWRKDKIGYAAPQDQWMQQEENQKLVNLAIDTLAENGWLNKNVEIPTRFHWKILMLYSLLKFSQTDFTRC